MKLKGRRFETVSDIQMELQAVLDSIKENDFHGASEARKKRWYRSVYVPKETILKEMTAKIKQVKSAFLFLLSPGTFRYTSYLKIH
jgi:hypothetical protein